MEEDQILRSFAAAVGILVQAAYGHNGLKRVNINNDTLVF